MSTTEVGIERRLRTELRRGLGWQDINIFGKVFCWHDRSEEIIVCVEYRRRSVGINVNQRFTFPAGTPADEVVDSVMLCLTFNASADA